MGNEDSSNLSQSDLQARRLLDIVLTLLGSSGPVSSSRLHELHYPDTQYSSFRKLFSRDRQRLAICGITVRRANRPPDEPLWELDKERSFASKVALTDREAVILDVACAQLASDPSFPLANDLRMGLAKVDRLFDRSSPTAATLPPAKHDKRLATLETCLLSQHKVDIRYRGAEGGVTQRVLAPYGLFTLKGNTYVVGADDSQANRDELSAVRTYRVDRILSIRECKDTTYVIPLDFDINDYLLLPFQLGPFLYYAYFVPYGEWNVDLSSYYTRNTYVVTDNAGRKVLKTSVSDECAAAEWAIEQGLVPVKPASLVAAWKEIVRRSLASTRS